MEIYCGGAAIVVSQKSKGELQVLLGERADGQGLALPAGKKRVSDGILKFTALRELEEECGLIIPKTPDYLLRVKFAFRNFSPFKILDKESGKVLNNFMAISDVYSFELREDEDLNLFTKLDNDKIVTDGELKNVRFYSLKDVLNSEGIFPPTLATLNRIFEKDLTRFYNMEVLG